MLMIDWMPLLDRPASIIPLGLIEVEVDLLALILGAILLALASMGFGVWIVLSRRTHHVTQEEIAVSTEYLPQKRRQNGRLYNPVLLDDRREWELEQKREGDRG